MRFFVSLLRFRLIFILFFVLFLAHMLCEMYSSRDIWASWCDTIKETIGHHAVLSFPFFFFFASTFLTLII